MNLKYNRNSNVFDYTLEVSISQKMRSVGDRECRETPHPLISLSLSLPPKTGQKTPAKLRSIEDVKYLEYGDINEPDKRNKKNLQEGIQS